MKSDYEQTLDKNFNKALELCSENHTTEHLLRMLKDGNIAEKQYSALEINELRSQEDAEIFLSNLVNCDGKIREAVAQKLSEFAKVEEYRKYFTKYPKILAKSTIDINANISRMVIDSLIFMKDYKDFGTSYSKCLKDYIYEAFEGLDKIIYKDKKYTINKQLFKLYWCLEGLNNYINYLKEEELFCILKKTLEQNEYTVREKVAQIVVKLDSEEFDEIKNALKKDSNYYIQKILSE